MDAAHFDTFTRHLGSTWQLRPTRRGFLAAGLGAALLLDDAQGKRKRKRCRKAGQTCVSHGTSLGTCCKHSTCQEVPYDQRTFCLCQPGYSDPYRTGHCRPVECGSLGEVCTSSDTCCPSETGSGMSCAPILETKGPRGCGFRTEPNPPSRCCLAEGGSICTGDCDCCEDLTCQNGRCRTQQPVCLSRGEACTAQAECCGGESNRVACERIDSAKLRGSCGPAFLGDRCCTTEGWECSSGCECCGAMACINGTCSFSLPGQECRDTTQCLGGTCQTVRPKPDGSCLIPINQPPPQLCCFHEGHECFDSCECCGTLTCQDRVCSSFLSDERQPQSRML